MSTLNPALITGGRRSRRKGNKSLTSWVAFVKKVAREEKLPYGKAMKRASVRKNKGEKWMTGGKLVCQDKSVPMDDNTIPREKIVEDEDDNYNPENIPNFGTGDGAEFGTGDGAKFGTVGGGRRRSKKSRRSKKRRGTKKRRGSRRRHH